MPLQHTSTDRTLAEARVRSAITALRSASARRRTAQPGTDEYLAALNEEQSAARRLEGAARALP
jgi:hypothetical protein